MEFVVAHEQGDETVTVIRPYDRIDGSNYMELVVKAEEEYAAGARRFLLDLAQVDYVSSAALVAFHKITILTLAGTVPDGQSDWEGIRAAERNAKGGYQPYLKLLNPSPRVEKVLSISGMDRYLQVFTDMQAALDSF